MSNNSQSPKFTLYQYFILYSIWRLFCCCIIKPYALACSCRLVSLNCFYSRKFVCVVCVCMHTCVWVCICVCVCVFVHTNAINNCSCEMKLFQSIKQILQYMVLAVDWDEPHTSRNLGMVIMYTNNFENKLIF